MVEEANVVEEEEEAVLEATTIITSKSIYVTTLSKAMTDKSARIQNRIISDMPHLPT